MVENEHCFRKAKCLFGLRGEGGKVKGSRVELVENKLILGKFYSTPPPFPSIQMNHNCCVDYMAKHDKELLEPFVIFCYAPMVMLNLFNLMHTPLVVFIFVHVHRSV